MVHGPCFVIDIQVFLEFVWVQRLVIHSIVDDAKLDGADLAQGLRHIAWTERNGILLFVQLLTCTRFPGGQFLSRLFSEIHHSGSKDRRDGRLQNLVNRLLLGDDRSMLALRALVLLDAPLREWVDSSSYLIVGASNRPEGSPFHLVLRPNPGAV